MSDHLNMEDNLLKCGICREIYKHPAQLPCLHSFCKACIARLERDSHGRINCPLCEQMYGASQIQKDMFIQSLTDFLAGDREVTCQEHDKKCETFCKICECLLCTECEEQNHRECSVIPVISKNIQELFSVMSTTICRDVEDYSLTAADMKRRMVSEQQILYRQRSENATQVSTFFYNLKNKLMEHLMQQEQKLQEEINTYYEKNEDQISKKIKQCKSVAQRLEHNAEAVKIVNKTKASPLHFQILECMKNDLATCKSGMPLCGNGSIQFSPDESKIHAMFGITPCSMKFYDEQDREVVTDIRSEETLPEFNLDDFLSYKTTSNNDPHEIESANSHTSNQNGLQDVSSGIYLEDGEANISPIDNRTSTNQDNNAIINNPIGDASSNFPVDDATSNIPINDATSSIPVDDASSNIPIDDATSDLPTYEQIFNTPRALITPSAPAITETTEFNDNNCDTNNAFSTPISEGPTTDEIVTFGIDEPPNYFEYGDYVTGFKSRFADDVKSSSPVGMTWIGSNQILIVDRFNRKLKLVTEDGAPVSVVTVQEGEPWDVVYTSQKGADTHFCAVSVPSAKLILYVRVIDKVVIIKKLRTWWGYGSLAHDKIGHALVCGICPPFGSPAINIINSEGAILKEFVVDSLGHPLFQYPRSIDVTKNGEMVVCDWKMKRLLMMKTDGYIIGEYRGSTEHPLKEPIGTSLDGFGNILVTDAATNSLQTISVQDRQFVSEIKLNREINSPREINITSPGNYPKVAIVTFNSVAVFDLWTSDSASEMTLPQPSAPSSTML